jgi:hypothetical protein
MTPAQRNALLTHLADVQDGGGGDQAGTAPFTVTIGYVAQTGTCHSDGIVIVDAPQAITDAAVDWIRKTRADAERYVGWSMIHGHGRDGHRSGGMLIR